MRRMRGDGRTRQNGRLLCLLCRSGVPQSSLPGRVRRGECAAAAARHLAVPSRPNGAPRCRRAWGAVLRFSSLPQKGDSDCGDRAKRALRVNPNARQPQAHAGGAALGSKYGRVQAPQRAAARSSDAGVNRRSTSSPQGRCRRCAAAAAAAHGPMPPARGAPGPSRRCSATPPVSCAWSQCLHAGWPGSRRAGSPASLVLALRAASHETRAARAQGAQTAPRCAHRRQMA